MSMHVSVMPPLLLPGASWTEQWWPRWCRESTATQEEGRHTWQDSFLRGWYWQVKDIAPYLFIAFNISMQTSTESAIVIGLGCEKISQSRPLNLSSWTKHWDWWVYKQNIKVATYQGCGYNREKVIKECNHQTCHYCKSSLRGCESFLNCLFCSICVWNARKK